MNTEDRRNFAIALSEAVSAKADDRAQGARAFWFQAKWLGSAHAALIERERLNHVRAEAVATEAAETAHRLSLEVA